MAEKTEGDRAKGLRAMREKKHKGASINVTDLFIKPSTKAMPRNAVVETKTVVRDGRPITRVKAKKAKRK